MKRAVICRAVTRDIGTAGQGERRRGVADNNSGAKLRVRQYDTRDGWGVSIWQTLSVRHAW